MESCAQRTESTELARKQAYKCAARTDSKQSPQTIQSGHDGRYANDVDEVTSCQLASCRNAGDVSRASPGRTDRLWQCKEPSGRRLANMALNRNHTQNGGVLVTNGERCVCYIARVWMFLVTSELPPRFWLCLPPTA